MTIPLRKSPKPSKRRSRLVMVVDVFGLFFGFGISLVRLW